MKIKLERIKIGDIFSENSHYILQDVNGTRYNFKHLESNQVVSLHKEYVENLLFTADQFEQIVKVGKGDKVWTTKQVAEYKGTDSPKVEDVKVPGIRTVWENIHTSQVFTVCFKKQDKPLSAKRLTELKEAQVAEAVLAIENAQKAKKGVLNVAKEELAKLQSNTILPYEEGEQRILRGYKKQFTSRDGGYACQDLDMPDGPNGTNQRPVNINSLVWIVYNGTKYEME